MWYRLPYGTHQLHEPLSKSIEIDVEGRNSVRRKNTASANNNSRYHYGLEFTNISATGEQQNRSPH